MQGGVNPTSARDTSEAEGLRGVRCRVRTYGADAAVLHEILPRVYPSRIEAPEASATPPQSPGDASRSARSRCSIRDANVRGMRSWVRYSDPTDDGGCTCVL
jgi:hypothetical protein